MSSLLLMFISQADVYPDNPTGFFLFVLFRMACFACVFICGPGSITIARDIQSRAPELKHAPYPPGLYQGHVVGAVFSIICGHWCFLNLVSCLVRRNSRQMYPHPQINTIISSLIDGILCIGLSMAAVVQSRYLPHPLGICENLGQLDNAVRGDNWMDILGAARSSSGSSTTHGAGICKSEVLIWKLEIVMAALCGLPSLFMIRQALTTWVLTITRSFPKRACSCVSNRCTCGGFDLFRWLGSWIRYLRRRHQRSQGLRAKQKSLLQRLPSEKIVSPTLDVDGKDSTPRKSNEEYLAQLLSTYGLAKAIAFECHYSDFRALARVSRRLRAATLSSMNAQILKQTTCQSPSGKGNCLVCKQQICPGCTWDLKGVAFHVANCDPHCGNCFRRNFCYDRPFEYGEQPKKKWLPLKCLGHGSRAPGEWRCQRPRHLRLSITRFREWADEGDRRKVCVLCVMLDNRIIEQVCRGGIDAGGAQGGVVDNKRPGAGLMQCSRCCRVVRVDKGEKLWWGCRICMCECAEEWHDEVG